MPWEKPWQRDLLQSRSFRRGYLSSEELADGIRMVRAENELDVPTCRGADIPYIKGVNYTTVVDGFLVSANIRATAENIDADFAYSDHNPVKLTFELMD